MMDSFEIHEVVYILGILGTLAGLARFYFTRRADRDEIIRWRADIEHRMSNQESYAKRIEDEYKSSDAEFKAVVSEINRKFDELKDAISELKVDLANHRKACEGRI